MLAWLWEQMFFIASIARRWDFPCSFSCFTCCVLASSELEAICSLSVIPVILLDWTVLSQKNKTDELKGTQSILFCLLLLPMQITAILT